MIYANTKKFFTKIVLKRNLIKCKPMFINVFVQNICPHFIWKYKFDGINMWKNWHHIQHNCCIRFGNTCHSKGEWLYQRNYLLHIDVWIWQFVFIDFILLVIWLCLSSVWNNLGLSAITWARTWQSTIKRRGFPWKVNFTLYFKSYATVSNNDQQFLRIAYLKIENS